MNHDTELGAAVLEAELRAALDAAGRAAQQAARLRNLLGMALINRREGDLPVALADLRMAHREMYGAVSELEFAGRRLDHVLGAAEAAA